MSQSPVVQAIKMVCEEKNLPLEMVVETVEAALAAAYRKDFGEVNQNIKVTFNMEDGGFSVHDLKTVVEDVDLEALEAEAEAEAERLAQLEAEGKTPEVKESTDEDEEEKKRFNPKTEIMISEAKEIKKDAELGDEIKTELEVHEDFGRMAAQTAKQVVIQKLREAERVTVFDEYQSKVGELITGTIQRKEGRNFLVDIGTASGMLPLEGQVRADDYSTGNRMRFYVERVEMGNKGPEIRLSRTHSEVVRHLFEFEIPEISGGSIELVSVAREAGSRSKIAVKALAENIDPIGSCVGQRGSRVQTIINELGGEKIDIIEFDENPATFIANALSPAKVTEIKLDEENKSATVEVAEDQLSLAIGKSGQNVRLAAILTGWRVNIKGADGDEKPESTSDEAKEDKEEEKEKEESASESKEKVEKKDDASSEE